MRDLINRFGSVSDLVYLPRTDQQVDTNFKLQAYAIILLRGYGHPWVLFSFPRPHTLQKRRTRQRALHLLRLIPIQTRFDVYLTQMRFLR